MRKLNKKTRRTYKSNEIEIVSYMTFEMEKSCLCEFLKTSSVEAESSSI